MRRTIYFHPIVTSSNTKAPAIMIGEKAADVMFKEIANV